MGEECSTCRICSDKDEIRTDTTTIIKNDKIIKNKNEKGIMKEKSHKTSQKSTNQTVTSLQSNNNNNNEENMNNISNKIECNKYKRKEGRKSTLDSIKFTEKKKSEFEEELRKSINSIHERKRI